MSTEQDITQNIQAINPNLDKLKQAFPHCFDKNGDFDFAKFKAELDSNDINIAKEGYSLDWLGKSYARVLASDAATTLLQEDEVHNAKPENANSQNLLIKGDNLEILKHLSNAYYEKVKMIYIDPPYNTGSDGFVYNDDRKFTAKQLQDLAGVSEDEAKRILEFTQSNSNSHSAWLTFMYPRLYIAKQLLKDDGVIFVSIDDNEVAQLRLLLDEVFGEENFIEIVALQNNPKGRSQDKFLAKSHEYVLIYSKTILSSGSLSVPKTMDDIQKDYKLRDSRGQYRELELRNTHREFGKHNRPNLYYPFYLINETLSLNYNEGAIEIYPLWEDNFEGCWTWGKDKSLASIQNLVAKKVKDKWKIYRKSYAFEEDEVALKQLKSLWVDKRYHTEKGQQLFNELFPKNERLFQAPKSIDLVLDIIKMGSDKNSFVLDFFGGSGTSAHAVMQLNKEDGGNRKFILVQLPEEINEKNKAAYDFVKDELGITPPTIFEITKERIIRAAKQIGDTSGFKIFVTTPIWEDYDFKAEKLANAEKLFDDDKLTEADVKALFTTWKTYDGSALTELVEEIDLAGYKAYYTKQKLYLMHKGFSTVTLKALLEQIDADATFNPTAIIAFGYYFESKALREIAENIKTYNNKKNIDIDFITRY